MRWGAEVVAGGLGAGAWGMAAGAAGFIGFLAAVAFGSQLPVARRALGAGYVVEDLADALSADLPLRRVEWMCSSQGTRNC